MQLQYQMSIIDPGLLVTLRTWSIDYVTINNNMYIRSFVREQS